jgi:hypothetical protein
MTLLCTRHMKWPRGEELAWKQAGELQVSTPTDKGTSNSEEIQYVRKPSGAGPAWVSPLSQPHLGLPPPPPPPVRGSQPKPGPVSGVASKVTHQTDVITGVHTEQIVIAVRLLSSYGLHFYPLRVTVYYHKYITPFTGPAKST